MASLEHMQIFETMLLDETLTTIKLFCKALNLNFEFEKKYYLSLTSHKKRIAYLNFMKMETKKQKKKLVTRHVSKCCDAKLSNNVIMRKNQPSLGTTVYFVCSNCRKACDTKIVKVWVDEDSLTPSGEPNRFGLTFKNK